jgi:DNA adenine methylase
MKISTPHVNRRLKHFSPLRYPGGKAKLASYVKSIIVENGLSDGVYVEPFAGGAAVAMELLLQEYVSEIHINDVSRPVYCFWRSVLKDTDKLCSLIATTPITVEDWDVQKSVFAHAGDYDDLELGFATFYLNRTNRSGILNGGIIGGRDQTGGWKIDARYNISELTQRITSIARQAERVHLTKKDALKFLDKGRALWGDNTLIYLDPPYYAKGRDLYYDYYLPDDHAVLAAYVQENITRQRWMVSYDNSDSIKQLYSKCPSVIYKIGYSARDSSEGAEIMFFDGRTVIPPLVGPISAMPADS